MSTTPKHTHRDWATRWRHLWLDEGDAKWLLGPHGLDRLTARVTNSEQHHRGEIRICIEAALPLRHLVAGRSPRTRAVQLFNSLGVGSTRERNGVLIYLLLADRAIEVVVDPALAQRAQAAHWQQVVANLGEHFRAGRFEAGMLEAIDAVDQLLVTHCPAMPGNPNPNELPNRPVVM